MNIKELKQELLENKTRHYYVFIGEELALQDIYINKIKEISGLPLLRVNDVRSIYHRLTIIPLVKVPPTLYVIRNDDDYYKSNNLWKNLLKLNNFKDNILILLYSDIKKTSEFCKAHDSVLTSFDLIDASLLKNRLNATTGLDLPFCEDIVKMCKGNYGIIKNEITKLAMYIASSGCTWKTAYLKGKETKLLHEEIGDIIFDFTNAIAERKIALAYSLYPKIMKTEDGSAIKLLSVLYNTFRQILMIQSTPFKERTEEVLGISNGQIYATSKKLLDKYNLFELVNIIKKIREIEKGIKIGTVEEKYAVEYLMGSIW